MQTNNCFNRAVYVARYYGGAHLGPDRFRIYKELARAALDKLPPPMVNRLDLNNLLGTASSSKTDRGGSNSSFVFQPPIPAPIRAPRPVFTTPITTSVTSTVWTNPIPTAATLEASTWAETDEYDTQDELENDEGMVLHSSESGAIEAI